MIIYFDGGCKPNPGIQEIGVVIKDGESYYKKLGYGTNNQAEWQALLWATELSPQDVPVEIIGDSKLVINQALGLWKVNEPTLITYRDKFISKNRSNIKLTHVKRAFNLAGIYLENR